MICNLPINNLRCKQNYFYSGGFNEEKEKYLYSNYANFCLVNDYCNHCRRSVRGYDVLYVKKHLVNKQDAFFIVPLSFQTIFVEFFVIHQIFLIDPKHPSPGAAKLGYGG